MAGQRAAADKRERTIRLHGLPEGTQEGLLQQALEKIAPVQRVEVFAKSHEAIAELASQAVRETLTDHSNLQDVGTVLLRSEPFVFNGATITFSEQARRPKPAKPSEEKTALSFAPRAARRGGKVIGKARTVTKAPAEPVPPKPAGDQDFYRNLVATTNEKRKAEGDNDSEVKRQKI